MSILTLGLFAPLEMDFSMKMMNDHPLAICRPGWRISWAYSLLVLIAGCGGCGDSETGSETPRDVMSKSLAAYRDADRYSDRAALYLTEIQGEKVLKRPPIPFSISFARPNQMQFIVGLRQDEGGIRGESIVVSDGNRLRVVTPAQEEILDIKSPATLDTSYVRKAIDDSVIGHSGFPIMRIQMLLGSRDIDDIFPSLDRAELLEPDKIGDRQCWRVSIPTALGSRVYWVDQQEFLIRRLDIPNEETAAAFANLVPFKVGSARIEFTDAQFDAESEIERYRLETTKEAILVSKWLPNAPRSLPEQLGRAATDFRFTDLDGNDVSAKQLADKIVVMDFWATWCKPCLESMPKLSVLAEKYQDNPRVKFMAVNIEGPNVSGDALREVLEKNNVKLPIYRDLVGFNSLVFRVEGLPTTCILDGNGTVQMFVTGADPDLDQKISSAIDALLDGKDLAAEEKRRFREALSAREKAYADLRVDTPLGGTAADDDKASDKAAAESKPKKITLTKLWTCDELVQPGHILVTQQASESPRIYVHDGWRSIVELQPNGKVAETYDLELPEDAPVMTSRSVVDKSGVRYFVAFATKTKQVHVFDNLWKRRFSYPDEDFTHPGIADVLLADLDGDESPEINISFWGVAGIQSISFEGKRLWPRRLIKSLEDVRRLAATGPDDKGQRQLIASHYESSLATFAYGGERGKDISVPGHFLVDIFSDDLTGDGQSELCALATGVQGSLVALGINMKGDVAWNYPLPGVPRLAIEHVTTGPLPTPSGKSAPHWVLLAPDSSLHFVSAKGEVLDKFNYGSDVSSVALVEHNGKIILLASTPDGVDAWHVTLSSDSTPEKKQP